MKKTLISLLLALTLTASLTACNNGGNQSASGGDNTSVSSGDETQSQSKNNGGTSPSTDSASDSGSNSSEAQPAEYVATDPYNLSAVTLSKIDEMPALSGVKQNVAGTIYSFHAQVKVTASERGWDGYYFAKCVQTSGTIETSKFNKCISFTAPDDGTITVYAMSANKSETRTLSLYIGATPEQGQQCGGAIEKLTYNVVKDQAYYLGGSDGINIYAIYFKATGATDPSYTSDLSAEIASALDDADLTDAMYNVGGSVFNFYPGVKINADPKGMDGYTFTKRIQTGGTIETSTPKFTKSIGFTAPGDGTMTVYAISGKPAETRTLSLYINTTAVQTEEVGGSLTKLEYAVENGQFYYLGGSDTINIYGAYFNRQGGEEEDQTVYTTDLTAELIASLTAETLTSTVKNVKGTIYNLYPKVKISASNASYADDNKTFTMRIQTSGSIDTKEFSKCLGFKAPENGTLTVYAISAAGDTTTEGVDRRLELYDNTTMLTDNHYTTKGTVSKLTYTVEKGKFYYLGSPDNGVNIFEILFTANT